MGKHPIDHSGKGDAKTAKKYARVEREHADPITDPKVKAMTKASEAEDSGGRAKKYPQVEREQAEAVTDPKVRSMTKGARKDEEKSLGSRIKKFLKIDRQKTDS